jgi:O-acetyl-ADP-ribose deacetylase
MSDSFNVNKSALRLLKGDITDQEVEAFVYYAANDLILGSGYGNAIAVRGGPGVQEELKEFGTIKTTEAVVTSAGNMKAKNIIHAVGPKFQEEDLTDKLKTTVLNALKKAEEKGFKQVAFPPMGTGFYGVPLPQSADITLNTIKDYLAGDTKIEEIVIYLQDTREFKPYQEQLSALESA